MIGRTGGRRKRKWHCTKQIVSGWPAWSGRALRSGWGRKHTNGPAGDPVELFEWRCRKLVKPVGLPCDWRGQARQPAVLSGGIRVTAVEPTGAMTPELRKHVPAKPQGRTGRVRRTCEPGEAMGWFMRTAAALDEPGGPVVAHGSVLQAGGMFASFRWTVRWLTRLGGAVRAARAPFIGEREVQSPDGTPGT